MGLDTYRHIDIMSNWEGFNGRHEPGQSVHMHNTNERIRAEWSRPHSRFTPELMHTSRPMRPSYDGIPNFSFPVPPSPRPLRDYNMGAQQRRYEAEDAAEAGSKRSFTNMLTSEATYDEIVDKLVGKLNIESMDTSDDTPPARDHRVVKRAASNMTKAKARGVVLQQGAMAALELSLRDPKMQQTRMYQQIKQDVSDANLRRSAIAKYFLERHTTPP